MAKRNFLFGNGERLTEDISVSSGGAPVIKTALHQFAKLFFILAFPLEFDRNELSARPEESLSFSRPEHLLNNCRANCEPQKFLEFPCLDSTFGANVQRL